MMLNAATYSTGPWSNRRVLVVEDDEDILDSVSSTLQSAGYRVDACINGRDALDRLQHEPADAVVLDLMMPVMNGWEFVTAKNEDPSIAEIGRAMMDGFTKIRGGSRVDRTMAQRHSPRSCLVAAFVLGIACAAREPAARPPPAEYHPPPMPGFSIKQSRMCSCTVCSPTSCCGGAADDESSCVSTDAGVTCAAAVQSCTPRCARYSWRVPSSAACDDRRPAACCAGS